MFRRCCSRQSASARCDRSPGSCGRGRCRARGAGGGRSRGRNRSCGRRGRGTRPSRRPWGRGVSLSASSMARGWKWKTSRSSASTSPLAPDARSSMSTQRIPVAIVDRLGDPGGRPVGMDHARAVTVDDPDPGLWPLPCFGGRGVRAEGGHRVVSGSPGASVRGCSGLLLTDRFLVEIDLQRG